MLLKLVKAILLVKKRRKGILRVNNQILSFTITQDETNKNPSPLTPNQSDEDRVTQLLTPEGLTCLPISQVIGSNLHDVTSSADTILLHVSLCSTRLRRSLIGASSPLSKATVSDCVRSLSPSRS